jgi:septation ring formation regulator EzrA
MSTTPIQVTYSIEDVLARLEQKIDKRFDEVNHKFDEVNHKFEESNKRFDTLQKDITNIQVEIANVRGDIKALDEKFIGEIKTLNAKVDGLSKRMDNQEFISRSLIVGLVLAIAAGAIKLFFPSFLSNS